MGFSISTVVNKVKVKLLDGVGNIIHSTPNVADSERYLNTHLSLRNPSNKAVPVLIGQQTMDDSLPVTIAFDQVLSTSTGSLPLPLGASTETTLAAINGKLNSLGQKTMANSVPVAIASDQAISVSSGPVQFKRNGSDQQVVEDTSTPANNRPLPVDLIDVNGQRGVSARPLRIDPTGSTTQPISAASLPLPSGAATDVKQDTGNSSLSSIDTKVSTAAKQDTGNTSLGNIDTKTPALGQTTMAGSTPVVVASNQSAIPISASALPLPSGAATEAKQTQPGVDIGDVTINNGSGAGAVNIQDGGNSITVDGPVTDAQLRATAVPVSVASLPLPSGAATDAKQDTGNSSLSSIDTKVSTAAKQDTGNTSLSNIDGKLNSLGQKAMAGSVPITIASDQSTVPVSVASLPLPTGAATETTLAAMNAKFNSLGQKLMAASAPIVIASDQSPIPVVSAGSIGFTTALDFESSSVPNYPSAWRRLISFTVPATYKLSGIQFLSSSSSATNAWSRAVALVPFGSFNTSTNVFTPGTTLAAPQFMPKVCARVTTALSATATIVTLTYVNQDGVAGRTTSALTIPASSAVDTVREFILQSGDYGVRQITAVSDTANPTGVIEIEGLYELSFQINNTANLIFQSQFTGIIVNAGGLVGIEMYSTVAGPHTRRLKLLCTLYQ